MGVQFENIGFFTPVHFEKPSGVRDFLLEKVDDYFYFSGRKAVVLSAQTETSNREVRLEDTTQSVVKRVTFGALKIASFFTIVVPLVMLGLKMALRRNTPFHTVKRQSSTSDPLCHHPVFEKAHKSPGPRQYPPISASDTVRYVKGKPQSVHGQITVFNDDEIIEVCPISESKTINDVKITFTQEGHKAVIQQQATRGCTAAAATMLMVDHGKDPDSQYLSLTNLGDESSMAQAIQKAGLMPRVQKVQNNLRSLRDAITKHGPAVVGIQEGGSHVVVVDEISENLDKVRLRDPYHGWAIVVSGEAFTKRLGPFATNTLVQINRS